MYILSDPDYDGPYPGWFWESSSDLDGFPFPGIKATYGGGGFNIELGMSIYEICWESVKMICWESVLN